MITTRRVSLAGKQLDELDDRIIIQGIEIAAGRDQQNVTQLWGREGGGRMTAAHREYLDVIVKFSLRMKRDAYAERSAVFETVAGWAAAGGRLRCSQKPDRRLRVVCAQLPAEGDAMDWTATYSITFRAYGMPYWQQDEPSQVTVRAVKSAGVVFGVPGNVKSAMDFTFVSVASSTINRVAITAGDSAITLTGLGLAPGETLTMDHVDSGWKYLQRVYITGTDGSVRSVRGCMTADSDDDLIVEPGNVRITLDAGGYGDLTLSNGGRFA